MLAKALIEAAKEEANTSQINQAYYQHVAKSDKLNIRSNITIAKSNKLFSKMTQWQLVVACINGLVSNDNPDKNKDAWIKSFQQVNCHPRYQVPFPQWSQKIDKELITGEQFFKERTSLYDAMPAVWKHMDKEMRSTVYNLVCFFYTETGSKKDPWRIENVKKLVRYVKLDEVKTI